MSTELHEQLAVASGPVHTLTGKVRRSSTALLSAQKKLKI